MNTWTDVNVATMQFLAQADDTTTGGNKSGKDWDLLEMLTNGQDYGTKIMSAILALMGTVAIGWAVVQGLMKLFSERNQGSWMKIIMLLFLGGMALFGGFALFSSVASSANNTVDEFGGGNGNVSSMQAPVEVGQGSISTVAFDDAGGAVITLPITA